MASETIEDIVREMREGMGWPNPDGRPLTARVQDHLFKIYADRIEAADEGHCDDCKTCHADADCEYFSKIVKIVIAHAESHKEVKHD